MSNPSTTPPPPYGVFPYLGQTTATQQQSASALGQPALVFVQAASSFEQPGQVASAFGQPGQVALARQPALVIGQQLEADIDTGNHPVNESNIEALMPKLRCSDYYYTKPTIEELAARERVEPGYCGRVKDFVLGCHGAGSIRFLGEVDLRWVDLDSVIESNPRKNVSIKTTLNEVGFNGMAEITCVCEEKYSHESMQYRDTQDRVIRNVEYYKNLTEGRGAEFVSYDPINGEWKYRMKYFSGFGYVVFKWKGRVGLVRRIKKLMRKIKKMI